MAKKLMGWENIRERTFLFQPSDQWKFKILITSEWVIVEKTAHTCPLHSTGCQERGEFLVH